MTAEPLEIRRLLSTINLTGDLGGSNFYVDKSGPNVQIFQNQPLTATPFVSVPASDNDAIAISLSSSSDTVTVDYSGGDPIATGLTLTGGSGERNLTVVNSGSAIFGLSGTARTLTIAGSVNDPYSDTIHYGNTNNFDLFNGVGDLDQLNITNGSFTFNSDLGQAKALVNVDVSGHGSIHFGATQHLNSLTIETLASAVMTPSGGQVLDTDMLSVHGNLDLTNNDLIVNTPNAGGMSMADLDQALAFGYPYTSDSTGTVSLPAAGSNGDIGNIYSSTHAPGMVIGSGPESAILAESGPTSLDGQDLTNVESTAFIARYTLEGDANLDGIVNIFDFNTLVANFNHPLAPPAWYAGAFNYGTTVNIYDFNLLVSEFNQDGPASPTPWTEGTPFSITLPTSSPTSFAASSYTIDWGDGDFDTYPAGTATATHTFGSLMLATIQTTGVDVSGIVFHEPALAVAIDDTPGLQPYSPTGINPEDNIVISDTTTGTLITDNGVALPTFDAGNYLSLNLAADFYGTLTLDFSQGDPLPIAGLTTDCPTINFIGTNDGDTLLTTGTAAIFASSTAGIPYAANIRYPSSTGVTFENAGSADNLIAVAGTATLAGDPSNNGTGSTNGGPTVTVNNLATVLFTGNQHLSALNILPGGTARMVQYGSYVLATNSLYVASTNAVNLSGYSGGLLDLSDNDLIVHGGSLPAIASLLGYGFDGNKWDGSNQGGAIDSTTAMADPQGLESLGYAEIGNPMVTGNIGDLNLQTFDGQNVATGDVVVKFTYYGDANLDGTVDSTDQGMLTYGMNNSLAGWSNGDFNYDGVIDSSDQTLMDVMNNQQAAYQNANVPSGTITLTVGADFPVTNLPTQTPTGVTIASWQAQWGNGNEQTFLPGIAVTDPYEGIVGSYIATLIALDANGNPEYYYPHITVVIADSAPPAPTALVATESNSGEVDLSWSDDTNLTSYFIITVMPAGGSPTTYTDSSNSLFYNVTGLSPGQQYTFSVTAVNQTANGSSLSSSSVSAISTPAGSGLSESGPQTVVEDSAETLSLIGGSDVTNWSVTWTNVNGGTISTIAVTGSTCSALYPTNYLPQIIAKVTARDSVGNSFSLSKFFVNVLPIGYSIDSGPDCLITANNINATATQQFSGPVATFTCSDLPSAVASYTATINWGDGNTTAGTITALGGGSYSVTAAYTYSTPGVAPLLVEVDNGSGDPASGLGTATVSDHLTIANVASAVLEDDGVTVDLSALGQDAAGPDQLTYKWTVTGGSGAAVTFDDNDDNEAQNTFATLWAAGTYDFTVTISNPSGQSVTSSSSVLVAQVDTDISLSTSATTLVAGQSATLNAVALDQFGTPLQIQPMFMWDVDVYGRITTITGQSDSYIYTTTAASPSADVGEYTAEIGVSASDNSAYAQQKLSITPSDTLTATLGDQSDQSNHCFNVSWPTYLGDGVVAYQEKLPGQSQFIFVGSRSAGPYSPYYYEWKTAEPYTFRMEIYENGLLASSQTATISSPANPNGDVFNGDGDLPDAEPEDVSLDEVPVQNGDAPSVRLAWEGDTTTIIGCKIERSVDCSPFQVIGTEGPGIETFTDFNPPVGATLEYYVDAYSESIDEGPGNPSRVSFDPNCPIIEFPIAPTGLTAQTSTSAGTVNLSWTDPNPSGFISGFQIQWSEDGSNFDTIDTVPATAGTTQYRYTDSSPTVNGDDSNYYRIVAYHNAYTSDSGQLESNPSSVAQAIVTAAPIAVDDTDGGDNPDGTSAPYSITPGNELIVDASKGILNNDYDLQGLGLTVDENSIVQPRHGDVIVSSDGGFVYIPNQGFTGLDTFSYQASNGTLDSSPAEVDIDVAYAPVTTSSATFQVPAGQASSSLSLANSVTNPSSAPLIFTETPSDTGPAHGTVVVNADGSFTYTPNAGYTGLDHFSYQASDGHITSNDSIVILAVGTEYYTQPSPPAASATSVPAVMSTFPNSLQGLWNAWQAARDRMGQVAVALQNFGKASALCSTITSATEGTPAAEALIDSALAAQAIVTQDYNLYTVQQQAAVSLAGQYMKGIHFGSYFFNNSVYAGDALNAISALPIDVMGIGPSQAQLNKYRAAFENYANGADFMVANNTFVVEVAKDTHDALQTSIKAAGIYSIAETGAEILTEQGCALFVQYATKQIINTAVGVVAAQVSQSAIALAAQFSGLNINPDYLRIGADAMQVFFLVKAARAEKLAQGANCFSGNTLVQTGSGTEAISQIQDGDRVLTNVAETPDQGGPLAPITSPTAVDPATWREVNLTMPDPTTPGDSYNMQLLEPLSWITANQASVGDWVSLNLPELQISGDVQVESIRACPTIQSGPGQVVLGTFEHVSNDVVNVNLVGESQPLQVTAGHKLWSLDADGWVEAGDLYAGERLAGENGPVVVSSVTADPQVIPVYNLDVENDHRYLVTGLGVLAHNVDPCPDNDGATSGGEQANALGREREATVAGMTGGTVSGELVSVAPYGTTDIDVVGSDGSLIAVGGPAKASNLGNTGRVLRIYKTIAAQRNVSAKAYFASNTPQEAINLAKKILGDDNVFLF